MKKYCRKVDNRVGECQKKNRIFQKQIWNFQKSLRNFSGNPTHNIVSAVLSRFSAIFGRFRPFSAVPGPFPAVSGRFRPFSIVFGQFPARFWPFSAIFDRFRPFSGRFRAFSAVLLTCRATNFVITNPGQFKFWAKKFLLIPNAKNPNLSI